MYKIGDIVKFTFLGEHKIGELIEKRDGDKWKIRATNGRIYSSINAKVPVGGKTPKPIGLIIEKV